MSFLKNIFGKTETRIKSYGEFWDWFRQHEKEFFKVVKERGDIEKLFFNKLSPKLGELKDGFYFLTGMSDDHTVELILTADGAVRNIPFVEELVHAAPQIPGWKFIALKPALDIENFGVDMAGHKFDKDNLSFFPNEHADKPDLIDITVVHPDLKEQNKAAITNGTMIFLDNWLGELMFTTTIDDMNVIGTPPPQKELIPIGKLKDYLNWRQKEFVEKYEGVRRDTENDSYSAFEAQLENGHPLIAMINMDLIRWDSKASHPWVAVVGLQYDGSRNNGFPDDPTYQLLNEIENGILLDLKDEEGYLNIGRQTAENVREVYFACKDFRKPSKVLYALEQKLLGKIKASFEIYKDKYWQSFGRFSNLN